MRGLKWPTSLATESAWKMIPTKGECKMAHIKQRHAELVERVKRSDEMRIMATSVLERHAMERAPKEKTMEAA